LDAKDVLLASSEIEINCDRRRNSQIVQGRLSLSSFAKVMRWHLQSLEGARDTILDGEFLDEGSFDAGIDGLHHWKAHSSAALWYTVCCAEGIVPR